MIPRVHGIEGVGQHRQRYNQSYSNTQSNSDHSFQRVLEGTMKAQKAYGLVVDRKPKIVTSYGKGMYLLEYAQL